MKILILFILIIFLACTEIKSNSTSVLNIKACWKLTTQDLPWQDREEITILKGGNGKVDIEIDLTNLKQEIDGFGGAFNEKGWVALSVLTDAQRDDVIKELFDPGEGARFNICRVPIGASDYAVSRYTLNETKNDFEMKYFSLERDQKYLIPYIKKAMEYNPDLIVWGSAWTPPAWMKTNGEFDSGKMKDEPEIYAAYALYLARFVEEYQKEGINLYAVAVQNEPTVNTKYPSCYWTPEQFLTFIRDYLGPVFRERNVRTKIMLGTMQDRNYNKFPRTVLTDPDANKYIDIVGFQWFSLKSVAKTRKNFPDKNIMQTETECGNWSWRMNFKFDPDKPQNDWAYGSYTWKKIKAFFDKGVNSYMLWNMILDEEGKNIDAKRPWPQNAAVVIDKNKKEVIYTPMFYAFKHFSYFVKPGAYYVKINHGKSFAIAFLNPDGSLIIELENSASQERTTKIGFDEYWFEVTLPPISWSTIVVPPLQ